MAGVGEPEEVASGGVGPGPANGVPADLTVPGDLAARIRRLAAAGDPGAVHRVVADVLAALEKVSSDCDVYHSRHRPR